MEKIAYQIYDTPIGKIALGSIGEDLVMCSFECENIEGIKAETDCLKRAYKQLMEYFEGQRRIFDLNYRFLKGTSFQHQVWRALLEIPYGEIATYQQIAQKVGSPQACRAVGKANHDNPIAIFIPCHRVIGAHHQLVGYAGGLEKKSFLLNLERQV